MICAAARQKTRASCWEITDTCSQSNPVTGVHCPKWDREGVPEAGRGTDPRADAPTSAPDIARGADPPDANPARHPVTARPLPVNEISACPDSLTDLASKPSDAWQHSGEEATLLTQRLQ